MEVSLKKTLGSCATGQEYFQVFPLSVEIIRWTDVRSGFPCSMSATTQKSRPSRPSQRAPRLYAGNDWSNRPTFLLVGTGGGRCGPCQERPPSLEIRWYPPRKIKLP